MPIMGARKSLNSCILFPPFVSNGEMYLNLDAVHFMLGQHAGFWQRGCLSIRATAAPMAPPPAYQD